MFNVWLYCDATSSGWEDFVAEAVSLESFNNSHFVFRYVPVVIEVNLDDFYAEYDSCNSTNHKEIFLEELIEKYLPRDGTK